VDVVTLPLVGRGARVRCDWEQVVAGLGAGFAAPPSAPVFVTCSGWVTSNRGRTEIHRYLIGS